MTINSPPQGKPFMIDERGVSATLSYIAEYSSRIPFSGRVAWDRVLFAGGATAEGLETLYRDPGSADGNASPNEAFLLAFIRLLEDQKLLLNTHAERHRQLYYRGFLGLAQAAAKPDCVAVSFELEPGPADIYLEPGLLLDGGQDSAGNALHYALDLSLLANQGRLSDLRWCVPGINDAAPVSRILLDADDAAAALPPGGVRLFCSDTAGDRPVATGVVASAAVLAMTGGLRTILVDLAAAVDPTLVTGWASGDAGWMQLAPSISVSPGTLASRLWFTLGASDGAIVPPHGLDNFHDSDPLIKLTRADAQEMPEIAGIATSVDTVAELTVWTPDGGQDPAGQFLPFGQTPVVGAAVDLAASEFYNRFDADVYATLILSFAWIGLPTTSFASWYTGYPGAPEDNAEFKVQAQRVWKNGKAENIGTPVSLFAAGTTAQPIGATVAVRLDAPLEGPFDPEADPRDQRSWLRLELTPKDFLASEYFAAASVAPVNEPYTPQVKSLLVRVEFQRVTAGSQYRLTPFGHQDITLPAQSVQEAELYLGFANLHPGQDVNLYWQLQSAGSLVIAWEYLDEQNNWQSLAAVVSDDTDGLSGPGLWRAPLPVDAADNATAMPPGRCWIRGRVSPQHADAYPLLFGLCANASTATLVASEDIEPSHYEDGLAAESITASLQPVPGLATILQPWSSTGGRPGETAPVFNTRVAEVLRHRGRALTRSDIHVLLLEHFGEVHDLKLDSVQHNGVEVDTGADHYRLRGVVIAKNGMMDNSDRLRPAFGSARLRRMENYILSIGSAWLDIIFENPGFRSVVTLVDVVFVEGINPDYGYREVEEHLSRSFMPWAYDETSIVRAGYGLDYYSVVQTIQSLEIVKEVVALQLDGTHGDIAAAPDEVLILDFQKSVTAIANQAGMASTKQELRK